MANPIFSISTYATQLFTTSNLASEQTNLANLNQQLASGQLYGNLTQYTPVDAHSIMNFQNGVTQRQSYIAGMQTVNSRLTMYDATMNDMENITAQAQELASSNQTYDSTKTSQLHAQLNAYLQQMEDDLNQKVSGRYVYAGTRYTTPPVGDLASMGAPTLPFTAVTASTLPDYDSEAVPSNSLTINGTPSGNFQVGNTAIHWSDLAAGTVTNVYINGVATPVTVAGLTAPATTPTQLAANLQSTINQISSQVSDFAGLSATNTGPQVDLTYAGNPATITPDITGTSGQITWSNSDDGTVAQTMATTDPAAWAQDSVTADANYNVTYGVTSTDPSFQKIIAGLRLFNAATQQTNPTTYQTDVLQAATLLSDGLSALQGVHAGVAGNINILKQQTDTQNTDISNLKDQLSNIQQVDISQVGIQINLLQTQLQASYSATATLIQESILKYL